MPDLPYHAAVDRLPKHLSPSGAVHRAIVETNGASIQFHVGRAGAWLAPPGVGPGENDRHAFDQTHIVLSGRLEMTLEEAEGVTRGLRARAGRAPLHPGRPCRIAAVRSGTSRSTPSRSSRRPAPTSTSSSSGINPGFSDAR